MEDWETYTVLALGCLLVGALLIISFERAEQIQAESDQAVIESLDEFDALEIFCVRLGYNDSRGYSLLTTERVSYSNSQKEVIEDRRISCLNSTRPMTQADINELRLESLCASKKSWYESNCTAGFGGDCMPKAEMKIMCSDKGDLK